VATHDEVATLLAQRTAMRGNLTARVENAVLTVLAQFATDPNAWYDHAAITEMTGQVVAYVEAAQTQAAQLTDAYLIEVATRMRPTRPFQTGGAVEPATLRRGVTHEGAYGRLADQYRYMASIGHDPAKILSRITERARVMVGTDLQLALRNQSMRWMWNNDLELWRRIIRPELATEGTCALCVVASDRVYYRGDLMPIHDRCGCDVLPIIGDDDPGRFLNSEDLEGLYDQAGSTYGSDLKNVRVRVDEHGELGPVLSNANHTRPVPPNAAAARQATKNVQAEIDALERTYADLQARAAAGADVAAPLAYQRDRLSKLRAAARDA